ncbi:3,4-dihydroxy-2-butanone-4-phosphate synthase, partial [Sphingobium sp.]|uniref:3,4-dihydroxy-2-butanone-4-phosphate synthase n=1 Tax=Sphingobium sp. TaxID=1912891 RepID=UPI0026183606
MAEIALLARPETCLSPIEDIIEEAKNGRMFILVDDEDRENEGDLIIPGQMVTPDAINFMAKHGRGLICLAMTKERVDALALPAMSSVNGCANGTAFTVSIEAREGVTTGISAADRARTIMAAIDTVNGPEAIVSPGHIFPLAARPGGVLVRAGHTEAAVDIARLAGLNPSGVICEIMKDDGTMARLKDLAIFGREHGIKIGTIRDLIAYRRRHDHLVERVSDRPVAIGSGANWRAITYRNRIDGMHHLALVKGEVHGGGNILVRMHALSVLDDVLGRKGPRQHLLQQAIAAIEAEGRGLLVLLSPAQSWIFDHSFAGEAADNDMDLRSYGVGAQILADLDVHAMTLLTNAHCNIVALEGWGIKVEGESPIA